MRSVGVGKWHIGKPPAPGWYHCNIYGHGDRALNLLRWWDGRCWSVPAWDHDDAHQASAYAMSKSPYDETQIEWRYLRKELRRARSQHRLDELGHVLAGLDKLATEAPWARFRFGPGSEFATVAHVGDWSIGVPTPGIKGGNYREHGTDKDDADLIVTLRNNLPVILRAFAEIERHTRSQHRLE
jgi:hypothetical protein